MEIQYHVLRAAIDKDKDFKYFEVFDGFARKSDFANISTGIFINTPDIKKIKFFQKLNNIIFINLSKITGRLTINLVGAILVKNLIKLFISKKYSSKRNN